MAVICKKATAFTMQLHIAEIVYCLRVITIVDTSNDLCRRPSPCAFDLWPILEAEEAMPLPEALATDSMLIYPPGDCCKRCILSTFVLLFFGS
jgi:hypothetical protein